MKLFKRAHVKMTSTPFVFKAFNPDRLQLQLKQCFKI